MKTVGIDVGHCESAGATSKENQGVYEVDHVNAQDKDKIIVTQIMLTNEQMEKLQGKTSPTKSDIEELGEIKFGNTLPDDAVDGEKFIYFKVPPKKFDEVCAATEVGKRCGITHGMLMACYAHALVESMFSHNPSLLSEGDVRDAELFVGCPATEDWTAEDAREKYAELIERATGVKKVEIVPESRAAMFSSVENSAKGEGRRVSALNGAVVFDFGSSTADCTYMLLGRKLIEFSWTLGASAIEREMVMTAYEDAQSVRGFEAEPSSFVKCENDMRKVKEGYYNGQYGADGKDFVCTFKAKEQKPAKQIVTVNDNLMNHVVNEREINIICDSNQARSGSWYELCREFFEEARDALEREGLPVETIVLTGGASKMGFIYELCREVFRGVLPEENIICEENPSYTVANGLVWIARCEQKLEGCISAAKDEVKRSITVYGLKDAMCESIYDMACDLVKREADTWAAREDDLSYYDDEDYSYLGLLNAIKIGTQSGSFKERIKEICTGSVNRWKANLSDSLMRAVNGQVVNLYSDEVAKEFVIPEDIWEELSGSGFEEFSFGGIGNPLSAAALDTLSARLASGATQVAVWAAIMAVATVLIFVMPVLGFVVTGLAPLIAAYLAGQADDAMKSKLLESGFSKKRKKKSRQRFAAKMKDKLPESRYEMMESIKDDLSKGLADYENNYDAMVEGMLTAAFEIVTLKRFGSKSHDENDAQN